MSDLMGRANFGNCDAHYAPVVPENPLSVKETIYYARKDSDGDPVYDEFVVFQYTQIVPRFLVYFSKK